jgi:serine/threonine-protein kinase RsbW
MTARMKTQSADTNSKRLQLSLGRPCGSHADLLTAVNHFCEQLKLSKTLQYQLVLIVDELVTNSLLHGRCSEDNLPIEVTIEDHDTDLIITIVDSGMPFDPTLYNCPPCTDANAMVPGGVGLCLVRNLSKTMHYYHQDQQNKIVVTLTKTS